MCLRRCLQFCWGDSHGLQVVEFIGSSLRRISRSLEPVENHQNRSPRLAAEHVRFSVWPGRMLLVLTLDRAGSGPILENGSVKKGFVALGRQGDGVLILIGVSLSLTFQKYKKAWFSPLIQKELDFHRLKRQNLGRQLEIAVSRQTVS